MGIRLIFSKAPVRWTHHGAATSRHHFAQVGRELKWLFYVFPGGRFHGKGRDEASNLMSMFNTFGMFRTFQMGLIFCRPQSPLKNFEVGRLSESKHKQFYLCRSAGHEKLADNNASRIRSGSFGELPFQEGVGVYISLHIHITMPFIVHFMSYKDTDMFLCHSCLSPGVETIIYTYM